MKYYIIFFLLISLTGLNAQPYSILTIYSKSLEDETDITSFQLLLDKIKIVSFQNGDRVSIKILNPRKLDVKIRNRNTAYTKNTEYEFIAGKNIYWQFTDLTQYFLIDRDEAVEVMKNGNFFDSEKIKYIEIDCKDKVKIISNKDITIDQVDFTKKALNVITKDEMPDRPPPVGVKEIDDFVNKAFDIFETTKAFSDQIREINIKIQELMQVENIVGNPIKEVKKEAMLMQRYVKILINDSQKLVKIAPNILNGAKKLKFTKIASATKNILNSIDAAKWSLITLGELLNDLPQLLSDISNFEKKNNIKDTKVILPEIIEEESNETDSKNEMAGVVIINESELKSRNLSFGQMVFTKDTKRLFIYNGEKLKEIVLKDMK